jgi:hypothetical protein
MKIKDRCIIGDIVLVGEYTDHWYQINIHPTTFYRRLDQFSDGFKKVKDLYTELDLGQYVSIRFREKNDLTEFHRMHHEYL